MKTFFKIQTFILLFYLFASCKTSKPIIDGTAAYQSKQYALAADLLPKEISGLKLPEERYDKTLMTARAFSAYNEPSKAVEWYEKALNLRESTELMYEYALALKKNEDYTKAFTVFQSIIALDKDLEPDCRRHMEICELAKVWMNETQSAKALNISELNSEASDYAAYKTKEGTILFTSDRKGSTGTTTYTWTNEMFGDIYSSNKINDKYTTPQLYSTTINTAYYEGVVCLSKDQNTMYYTRCGSSNTTNDYCAIYKSTYDGVSWSAGDKLPLLHDSCNVGHPFLSADNKTLYFVSDEKGGFGGKDIYSVPITADGIGEPSNLGTYINTEYDEMFPTLDKDNTLYFSSEGHSGMGGLDIFSASKDKGIWKNTTNMRYPINSGADDFYLLLDKTKPFSITDTILKSGYFSSSRKNGKGFDDIYSYTLYLNNRFSLIVHVITKRYEDAEDPKSKILGMDDLKDARVELSADQIKNLLTNDKGVSKFDLEKEKKYSIRVTKPGYLQNTATVSTVGKIDAQRQEIVLTVDIELEKIFSNRDIEISNIYYDLDKATLREASFPALDSLVSIFRQNPDITVEIGSHTDSRGSDAYNLKLSQARAQSVVDYLISKGIEKERLIPKGYGETKLLNTCGNNVTCTEEEHQRNRRTTFRVVGQKINIESKE